MDEGYWAALLRDVEGETETLPASAETEDFAASTAHAHGGKRWPSTAGSDCEEDWQLAEELLASGAPTTVTIAGYNRGGLLADFGALQGFVPVSHLLAPILGQLPEQRAAALAARIGETLIVRVTEIDRDRCRLILSERLARDNQQADSLFANLRPGQTCQGQVTSLCQFGAFVDLGGFEGLIHISELS